MMGSSADEILIRVKAQGGRASAKDIGRAEAAIAKLKKASAKPDASGKRTFLGSLQENLKGVGPSSKVATGAMDQVKRSARGLGSDLGSVAAGGGKALGVLTGIGAAAGGVGLALGGLQVAKQGLDFNAQFQDAETSFKTFLGTGEKAKAFVEDLRDNVSNGTPFKLTDIFGNAKQLLGFGLNAKQAVATLQSVRSAALASGTGAEGFDRISLALGQIAAKGKISAEEMMQLAEAGVPVQDILRKTFKLTNKQMADIGNVGIKSNAALWAITQGPEGWDKKFGKAAENAKNNYSNQVAQMGKDWEQFQRILTEPLFEKLNKDVNPQVEKALQHATKTFARTNLTFDAKVHLAWKGVKKDLGPLAGEIKGGIDSLDIGQHLSDALSKFWPQAVEAGTEAFGKAAPKVISAFWNGFKDLSLGGQVLTAAFLLNRLRFPFWSAGVGSLKILASGMMAGSKLGLRSAGTLIGKTLGDSTAASASKSASPKNWNISDWAGQGAGKAGKGGKLAAVGGALGTVVGTAMAAYALNQFLHDVAGAGVQDIFKQLQNGVGGKNAPGTQPFTSKQPLARTAKTAHAREQAGPDAKLLARRERLYAQVVATQSPAAMNELQALDAEIAQRRKARAARGRATGGRTRAGETTLVGEDGPEIARFPANTEIVPNHVWASPAKRKAATASGRAPAGRPAERVVYLTPVALQLNGRELYRAYARQTEIETLPK